MNSCNLVGCGLSHTHTRMCDNFAKPFKTNKYSARFQSDVREDPYANFSVLYFRLMCSVAALLRQKVTFFGKDAAVAVECLHYLAKCFDARWVHMKTN